VQEFAFYLWQIFPIFSNFRLLILFREFITLKVTRSNGELTLLSIWKLKDSAYGVTIRENFWKIRGRRKILCSLTSEGMRAMQEAQKI